MGVGLVQGHTSLAATRVQETNFLPLPPLPTVQPSPCPEVGDRTMEYSIWPPRSCCNMTHPASQPQKDGLCLPSSFQSRVNPIGRISLAPRTCCQDLGTVFWVEVDTELQTTPGTALSNTRLLPPRLSQPLWLPSSLLSTTLQLGDSGGKGLGTQGPRVCSMSVAHVT